MSDGHGESCSIGCGFESHLRILDGICLHSFVVRIALFVCLKKTQNQRKEAGDGPNQAALTASINVLFSLSGV